MLLIYYNQNTKNFYFTTVHSFHSGAAVGNENNFGHTIIQILYITDGRLVNAMSFLDYMQKEREREEPPVNKLINHIIDLLNKFKK